MTALLPPKTTNEKGEPRCIGVELEMHGLPIEVIAEVVGQWVGQPHRMVTAYEAEIDGGVDGTWRVEFDFEYLKNKARGGDATEGLRKKVDDAAEDLLRFGAEQILPMEVVSPPVSMARLAEVDELVAALRDAGAQGTKSGLIYAFGTHLNPELPALDADTVVAYFKAFLCLFPWLRREADVDMARRWSMFIEPFGLEYTRKVCTPGYAPDMQAFIDDYLAANPTRNRVLDMLPLFAHIDENRVRSVIDDPRIKPRPTLHYRMPNCEIDRPGWGLEDLWRDWLQVEHLAADPDRLREISGAYSSFLGSLPSRLLEDWSRETEKWLVSLNDR